MELWIMVARTFRLRNEVIRERMGLTQTTLERVENMLKWDGNVVRMKDSRWPRRIMAWSSGERRRRRGRPEGVGEKVERVMRQKT
jgi:hypothetical protein